MRDQRHPAPPVAGERRYDSADGVPPVGAGPQPVLPQDRCGNRHITGITAIRVDGGYGGAGPAATPGHASAAVL
ncbi:hypothetical protein ACE1SV_10150 [Streptomyces sp. E-15]